MNTRTITSQAIAILLCSCCWTTSQAQLLNGSFENGLTDWTVGGTSQADSLLGTDFSTPVTPTDGNRLGLLGTGAGDVPGGGAIQIDGNGVNDFDAVTLSQTVAVNLFPLALRFDWAFASAEEDQPNNFDDVFDVTLTTVVGGTSQSSAVLTGSSNKPGGASPFPDAPAGPGGAVTINAGVTNGSNLRFGVPAFTPACIVVPNWAAGDNSLTLQFRAADQGDPSFDSALLLDNVRLSPRCDDPGTASLTQVTNSVGTQVEAKGGGLVARPALNTSISSSADSSLIAFVGRADYDGSNPNYVDQVYTFNNGAFTRITAFTGDQIQSVDTSPSGRYLVFSAIQNDGDNLEIFRFDRNTDTLTQITTTTACDNTSPSVNNNGRRIAFLSTCGAELGPGFNPDSSREMVFWNNGTLFLNDQSACLAFAPQVSGNNSGRYASFSSDCDYAGNNADGNLEVFRFDRNNNSFLQITDSSGPDLVLDSTSITTDGQLIAYIDTDLGGNLVIMRYDAGTGNSTFIGVSQADPIITVKMIEDGDGDQLSVERLSLTTFQTIAAHVDAVTGIETEVASGALGTAIALSSGIPIVHFISGQDHVGANADGNPEVFRGSVN